MMLAKLSGMPISTQTSSVIRPASSQRHQRQQHVAKAPQHDPQQDRDRHKREDAGVDESADDGLARFQDRDRRADRLRELRLDGAREAAQRLVVVGVALRQSPGRARGRRLAIHSSFNADGRFCMRHRRSLQIGAQARRARPKRHDERLFGGVALVLLGVRELGQARGQPLGRIRARTARVAGELGQLVGGAFQRGNILRIGRRARGVFRVQRRLQLPRQPADQRELALLICGNKSRNVVTLSTSGILRS